MQQTQALRGVCEDRGTAVARYVRTNRRDDGRHATGMYRPGPVAPSGHPARAARPASPARAAPLPARPHRQPEPLGLLRAECDRIVQARTAFSETARTTHMGSDP